jgi:tetratricopeptide (TPR) repeat protein
MGVHCHAFAGEKEWQGYIDKGKQAYQGGDYKAAVLSFAAALKEAEAFGPGDPRLATSLNGLAEVYRAQGHYTEAEPLYKRALAIWEKAFGPDHPDTKQVRDNLAALHRKMAKP